MCSICGIVNFNGVFEYCDTIEKMNSCMKHRGPDESDFFKSQYCLFGHNRLSVMDLKNGHQPMSATYGNKKYTIVYNGEIYNCDEIRDDLKKIGFSLSTKCDTEVVLFSYIAFGEKCVDRLNGIFAFCVYDGEKIFCARDRFGVKPFYYSLSGDTFVFASEIKAMLKHPKISSGIDRYGLWELLYLSPDFINGKSVFKDIFEINPGECLTFDKNGLKKFKYWQIVAQPYFRDRDYAVEKTGFLVSDAIKKQLVSDVPLCTLLSGGLDSSVVTAVANKEYKENGKILDTYSFEYEGNKEKFEKSSFQPEKDDDFATYLADYLGTNHTVLTAPTSEVASCLFDATLYRDFPGQADIDSSLFYFLKQIKKRHTVSLSGECADEIFGGYPWFYRPEMLYSDFFPWIHSPRLRPSLFKDELSNSDAGFDYIRSIYKKTISDCPVLDSDDDEMKTARRASYLSVNFFMTSLLQRKDRMSMASGLEIRVPFSDHRIYEFVYNVPWKIKFEGGVEKALLRNGMSSYLPEKILWRKKSPYPKTHNPEYFKKVMSLLDERLKKGSYLSEYLDREKLDEIISSKSTWFGQLMGSAQLIAWLVQFDFWLEKYNVNIDFQ